MSLPPSFLIYRSFLHVHSMQMGPSMLINILFQETHCALPLHRTFKQKNIEQLDEALSAGLLS